MNTDKYIYELHEDHKQWLNKLSFYQDEITVMQERIAEVNAKNTLSDTRAMVEHFQNQLIIRKEQIDILRHEINQQEARLNNEIKQNATAVDRRKIPEQTPLKEQINLFETVFNELRKEQNDFISKFL